MRQIRPRFLLVLLVLASGLALGFHLLFGADRGKAATAAPGAAEAPPPAVITMRTALPPGHILRADDLARVPWANGSPPDTAIIAGTPEAQKLAGAVTRRAFAAGELLVPGSVIAQGERGFLAALVIPGHRAIAVSVDAATAAGGLIWPGDRVDIVLTQEIREDNVPLAQRVVSETILTDVRILSTDQKLEQASEAAQGVEGKIEARSIPATVTLEVTPAEAERVTVAGTLGRLHLTLRGLAASNDSGDFWTAEVPATWAGGVSPALAAVRTRAPANASPSPRREAAPAATTPEGVRIYRGSGGADR